jgi:hypothetical protein
VVRRRDVRVGETYLVEVPHQLPRHRYPADVQGHIQWWQLTVLSGARFRLTVTEVDLEVAGAAAVEGVRVVHRSNMRLELSADQVAALGLSPGVYYVQGMLTDDTGRPVELPHVDTLRVPVRWLHPKDATRPDSHRDIDQKPW